MLPERGEFPYIRRLLTREVLPTIRDFLLEPIRASRSCSKRLSYIPPDYQDLSRAAILMWRIRGYLYGYLPIAMPAVMALSLATEGNMRGALGVTVGGWVASAAFLKLELGERR